MEVVEEVEEVEGIETGYEDGMVVQDIEVAIAIADNGWTDLRGSHLLLLS